MNVKDYLLGLATIPAAAAATALLWGAAILTNRTGRAVVNRLTPKRERQRAAAGAAMACARRTWLVELPFDLVLIFCVGHDLNQFDQIHDAIYRVIGPVARVKRRERPDADEAVTS